MQMLQPETSIQEMPSRKPASSSEAAKWMRLGHAWDIHVRWWRPDRSPRARQTDQLKWSSSQPGSTWCHRGSSSLQRVHGWYGVAQ